MARTVAVTGATGFLGMHLVAALAREGAAIRILSRRDSAPEAWQGLSLETVRGGLEDEAALARLVAGADAVVHAAGLISARSRAAFFRANQSGAGSLAGSMRRHAPPARLVLVSTLAARAPYLSDYADSKRAGEEAVRRIFAGAEEQLVIIRPPALYGPWDKATLPIFRAATLPWAPVLGRGLMAISHVTDAAEALARVAMGAGAPGVYALPGDRAAGYSMAEVITLAASTQGRKARLLQVPPAVLLAAGGVASAWGWVSGKPPVFSAGKAREMLHGDWAITPAEALPETVYKPQISLEDGFASTVAWYRENGWLS